MSFVVQAFSLLFGGADIPVRHAPMYSSVRNSHSYVDCFLIVISKFRTIDLYIPHTTNA